MDSLWGFVVLCNHSQPGSMPGLWASGKHRSQPMPSKTQSSFQIGITAALGMRCFGRSMRIQFIAIFTAFHAPTKPITDSIPIHPLVYSPAQRLGTFYQTHLMGGSIDPLAGDGSKTPSALPILTDNAALRPAIARLWRDSNWQIKKNVLALQGTVNGDVGIEVVDDPIKGRVYLEVVHAGKLSEIEYDPMATSRAIAVSSSAPILTMTSALLSTKKRLRGTATRLCTRHTRMAVCMLGMAR
jgi:hypothetical protein